jgi:hypothetical protein
VVSIGRASGEQRLSFACLANRRSPAELSVRGGKEDVDFKKAMSPYVDTHGASNPVLNLCCSR